jgi:hypothetical protein
MALNSNYFHRFEVEVTGDIVGLSVKCVVEAGTSPWAQFSLLDDANYNPITGDPDFASPYSGDVVAGDGIFTRGVNSNFAVLGEDNYTFRFYLINSDFDTLADQTSVVEVYSNDSPIIEVPPVLPSQLLSGFTPFDIEMTVSDPQGYQDIVQVKFTIFPGGSEFLMQDPEGDSVFTYHLEPEIAEGLYSGNYNFQFQAMDSLMSSAYYNDSTYIENGPPILLSPALHNEDITFDSLTGDYSLAIPEGEEIAEVKVTIQISEPQGLGDVDEVFANYERPTGIWTFNYTMLDNGLPVNLDSLDQGYLGDEIANDSVFTFTKFYTATVDPGLHKFHFHCFDKTQQSADSITVNLMLLQAQ